MHDSSRDLPVFEANFYKRPPVAYPSMLCSYWRGVMPRTWVDDVTAENQMISTDLFPWTLSTKCWLYLKAAKKKKNGSHIFIINWFESFSIRRKVKTTYLKTKMKCHHPVCSLIPSKVRWSCDWHFPMMSPLRIWYSCGEYEGRGRHLNWRALLSMWLSYPTPGWMSPSHYIESNTNQHRYCFQFLKM